jgi:hypothetical protein
LSTTSRSICTNPSRCVAEGGWNLSGRCRHTAAGIHLPYYRWMTSS